MYNLVFSSQVEIYTNLCCKVFFNLVNDVLWRRNAGINLLHISDQLRSALMTFFY